MGNPQRIPVEAIQAMKKILDALPDKNLGKTKEEALTMLGCPPIFKYSIHLNASSFSNERI